jgi:hypothetical protein
MIPRAAGCRSPLEIRHNLVAWEALLSSGQLRRKTAAPHEMVIDID